MIPVANSGPCLGAVCCGEEGTTPVDNIRGSINPHMKSTMDIINADKQAVVRSR